MTHEFAITKILIDNPDSIEQAYAMGLSPQKAETDFLRETLLSYEKLKGDGVKPNRDNLVAFIDFLDNEDRQEYKEVLTEVDVSGGTIDNLQAHIAQVTENWYRREVRNALTRAFAELNDSGDADAAVSGFKQAVEQLQGGMSMGDTSLAALAAEHEAYVRNLPDDAGKPHRLFGLPSLDEVRGLDPGTGEFMVIAASPKVGKSALLGNILRESARQNRPTYFASAETQGRKTYERLFASHTGLSSRMVSSPHVLKDKAVHPIYEAGKKELSGKDVFIEFKSLSIPVVRRMVHYYYHKHNVRLFIFDRLGLFEEAQKDEFPGRRKVTNQLRTLANELPGVKIVLASQITNESLKAKDKRPHVSHVFGGNGSQADATQVFMIYRPYHVDPASDRFKSGPWQGMAAKVPGSSASYAEVYCGLNNNGPSNGSAYLLFDGDRQIFEDMGMNKYVDIGSDAIEEELRDIQAGKVGLDIENLPGLDDGEDDDFDPDDMDTGTFGVPKMGTGGEPMF